VSYLLGGLAHSLPNFPHGLSSSLTYFLRCLSGALVYLSNYLACATADVFDSGAHALCELVGDLGIERLGNSGKSSRDRAEPTMRYSHRCAVRRYSANGLGRR
jgi:hypothetical protein